ncbi:MAG: hypothetical protein ACREYF_03705, partial [Gammaproteobacteria bacterium]
TGMCHLFQVTSPAPPRACKAYGAHQIFNAYCGRASHESIAGVGSILFFRHLHIAMNNLHEKIRGSPWFAALLLVPAFVITILFAGFFFALFISAFLVLGAILGMRFWWIKRRMNKSGGPEIIDGKFTVVDKRITIIKQGHTSDHGARDD